MKNPKKNVLTITILLILFSATTSLKSAEAQEPYEKTYRALFLVSFGYGDNYYDMVAIFSDWNWEIETAGRSTTVTGCANLHEPYILHCNLTFDDLDESIIKGYDCVIIPSGGHWNSLVNTRSVETILLTAHENGLVLGTLCIGQQVFAYADGLMDGVKVASFHMTDVEMEFANAKIINEDVVSDNRIVTGGGGGGLGGGGFSVAPTLDFCEAMKDTIQVRDRLRIILPILGSIGGLLVVSGAYLLVKKRNKIFLNYKKKVKKNEFIKKRKNIT